ncbi:mitogen-activated protein kinase kinase kinase 4 isoform X2 [Bacillus rossius redtenbacheri]|uniref:mitogen-activated protein kinase kinase kinase 4 isoform X2 n=1 Tax=Bacillus rossius redtenbacheri TaxID=93214 RepID=UPI002FDCE4E6
MSDDDWKSKVGIVINFSPKDDDDSVIFGDFLKDESEEPVPMSPSSLDSFETGTECGSVPAEELLFDGLGCTPPRTRISRKQKERKQREKEIDFWKGKPAKPDRHHNHHNHHHHHHHHHHGRSPPGEVADGPKNAPTFANCESFNSMYLSDVLNSTDKFFDTSQLDDDQAPADAARRNKRSMKLLRYSERDLKLDLSSVNHEPAPETPQGECFEDRVCSLPLNPHHGYKVETCNHFRSLTSKPVNFPKKKHKHFGFKMDCPQDRIDFYNTFSLLIRMGSGEKSGDKCSRRQLSHEEDLWQNELKDLLWLELQARHAGRSVHEQDEHLCRERGKVDRLLAQIMEYRFDRHRASDSGSSDSGVGTDDPGDHAGERADACEGCLSIFCCSCVETQNLALREVELLLRRLDEAEQLYSSSKAFGLHYPLYVSPEFTSRLKAMCIWFNMMRHQRLRLKIIGRMLNLDNNRKTVNWPVLDDNVSATDSSDDRYLDTHSISRSTSIEAVPRAPRQQRVHFEVDADSECSSPSDSNNSSSTQSSCAQANDLCLIPFKELQHSLFPNGPDKKYMAPYRRYMEHVLKTRGLRKSIQFFDRTHKTVLKKAMLTLLNQEESKDSSTAESKADPPDSYPSPDENGEFLFDDAERHDLKRYGYWSEDSRAMNLPSYCSMYLFLARVPVELTHQYLLMRLEEKPDCPSPLSVPQLVREFRDGISNAAYVKQRYKNLVNAVIWKMDEATRQAYEDSLWEFEKSIRCMLEVHLDYFRDCLQMVAPALSQKKNLLEEEWAWLKGLSPIIGGEGLVSHKVSQITVGLLRGIGQHLEKRMKTIMDNVENEKFWEVEDASPKHIMLGVCREFQTLFNEVRENTIKIVTFAKSLKNDLGIRTFARAIENINHSKCYGASKLTCGEMILEAIRELKVEILRFCDKITKSINDAETTCDVTGYDGLDDNEKLALLARCREVLHTGYKFGFEFHNTASRLICAGPLREKVVSGMISFAHQWMRFVMDRCERGRGLRPTWANQGLEFLTVVCEPDKTRWLSDKEFENLKTSIDECISHVVGSTQPQPHLASPLPRSRAASPSPGQRKAYLASRSLQEGGANPTATAPQRSLSLQVQPAPGDLAGSLESLEGCLHGMTVSERVYLAVEELEKELDEKLRSRDLIGRVKETGTSEEVHIRPRSVNFSWQRGIKIGQGRFGKVYTAVNNKTGELMAMKEVQLQPNDHHAVRHATEELRIFESIQHNHLVRYYGVEIHREEMLIFMEFCPQGTLESLVAGTESGLPEALVRRYTQQLLLAVSALHQCGVVHRDIKPANIFLTDEGNCLKLGDFGCAAKIKAHTTMMGELQGFIGTQAYMAPEMFMKTTTDGHGRASDVWSVGCVVVEMASGKRPWAEYDSNFQIMFKVGMGQTPSVPDTLSKEGHNFLSQCFQHDPKERAFACELLQHPFVRVDADDSGVFLLFSNKRNKV